MGLLDAVKTIAEVVKTAAEARQVRVATDLSLRDAAKEDEVQKRLDALERALKVRRP